LGSIQKKESSELKAPFFLGLWLAVVIEIAAIEKSRRLKLRLHKQNLPAQVNDRLRPGD
jgi:hypothetical protein